MTLPFIAEIKIFGGNFAPRGYVTCDGQLLSISQNTAFFALIGTFYGGNGTNNFAVPDFRGRAPVHWGQGTGLSSYAIGQRSGTENVTLLTTQLPAHTHQLSGGTTAGSTGQTSGTPSSGAVVTNSSPGAVFINSATSLLAIAPQTVGPSGAGTAHENRQPYLAMLYIIASQGVFPTRN